MQTKPLIAFTIVLSMLLSPVVAWPFVDDNQNYIPDEIDTLACDTEDPGSSVDGKCDDHGQGAHWHPPGHEHSTFESLLCSPSVPTSAQCNEDGYYTGPTTSGLGDPDAIGDAVQQAIKNAYDALAAQVNAIGAVPAEHGKGRITMEATDIDRDADGIPDAYLLHGGTDRDCTQPMPNGGERDCVPNLQHSSKSYIQSDFFFGPLSGGKGMLIDPRSGDYYEASAGLNPDGDGLFISIGRNTQEALRFTIDMSHPQNKIILEVYDSQFRYVPSPTYPVNEGVVTGHEEGEPVYWSAPADLRFVRFLPIGDMDDDRVDVTPYLPDDVMELSAGSHPINAASTPLNKDGDACPVGIDPDDNDPSVCFPFPYTLTVETPDSDLTDDLNHTVWETVTFPISAIPIFDEDHPGFRKIVRYETYITHEGAGAHKLNETLTAQHGTNPNNWPKDICDVLPETDPTGGQTDGTPENHEECPYFRPPNRLSEDPTKWTLLRPVPGCSGEGLFTQIVQTCTYATGDVDDGEYHFYMIVCLEGEDCGPKFKEGLDLADHVGMTDHFIVNNKPLLKLLDKPVDLDGITDKNNQASDEVYVHFNSTHSLGHPIVEVTVNAKSQATESGSIKTFGEWPVTFDVSGMTVGETRTVGLDSITLVDAENGTYNATLNTTKWKQRHDQHGAKLDISTIALSTISGKRTPAALEETGFVRFFNNRAPEVREFNTPSVEIDSDTGIATVKFVFRYEDVDRGGVPALNVTIHDAENPYVGSTESCTKPGAPPLGTAPPAYNSLYTCTLQTAAFGEFNWTVTAIDTDRTNNTTAETITNKPVNIVNTPPALESGKVETDPLAALSGDGNRTVKLQVRYRDAEEIAQRIYVVVSNTTTGETREVNLTTGATCQGEARLAGGGVVSDHCGSVQLPEGEWEFLFHGESIRAGEAVFPEDGTPIQHTVSAALSIACDHCHADSDLMNDVREQSLMVFDTLNGAIAGQKIPVNPWTDMPRDEIDEVYYTLICCKPGEQPADDDEDGFSNDAEAGRSDPNDPWSNPLDADADLYPDLLDNGPVEIDLWRIEDDSLQLKPEGHISAYGTLQSGNARGTPLAKIAFHQENDYYNVDVTLANGQQVRLSGVVLEYEVTRIGFILNGYNLAGDRVIHMVFDAEKIGVVGQEALHVKVTNAAMFFTIGVETNPMDVTVDSHMSQLQGFRLSEYTLCVNDDNCFAVPITRFGFEQGRGPGGLPAPWMENDDGSRTYLLEGVPKVPEVPDLPGGPDGVDEDGDLVPDEAEPTVCGWEIGGTELDGTCEGDDYTPPQAGGDDE